MGKLTNVIKKRRVIILEKPSGTIAIVGDMNALQRKLYDVFLFKAKNELKKDVRKDYFKILLSEIIEALDLEKPNKQRLKQIIRDLVDIKIEYNYLKKDGETWGISSVLNDVEVDFDDTIGKTVISYSLPRVVKDAMVKKNGVFAKIDLVVVKGLRSKHAILLYELIKDYEKVQVPEMSMKDFRKIFGVEDKYPRMPDLRKYVLDSACDEINNNPHTDFTVSYELKKNGKAYTHIKFYIKPKPVQLKLEQQAKVIFSEEIKDNEDAKELLALIPADFREKVKVVGIVLGGLKTKGKEYVKAQIEYVVKRFREGKIKNFVVYLKKAIEKDYAGAEKIDTGILSVENAIGAVDIIEINGKRIEAVIGHIEENGDEYLVRFDWKDKNGENRCEWYKASEDWLLNKAKEKKSLSK